MTDVAYYVSALSSTWSGLASAVSSLSEDEWCGPTDLPGWSVKDNVSHVAAVELILLGEPYPSSHVLPSLPYLRSDVARFMEVPVDLRRSSSGASVLAELRSVVARRLAALSVPGLTLDDEVPGILGRPTTLGALLPLRVFDCWTHEQDVRRALGLPRSLTSSAAAISRERLLRGLTTLGEDVPRAAGRSMVVVTTGAVSSAATVLFGEGFAWSEGSSASADVRVTVDFETFLLLGTGRVHDADVLIEGDVELGRDLVRVFAVTP
jgi:uncharacterized protein (TIGR03083 family)